MTDHNFKIKYRVITSSQDVWAALNLRYVTYRHVNFISANKDMIDVDPYDFHSTYLGAFQVEGSKETLIGTMRIISGHDISATAPIVREIVAEAKSEEFKALPERPMPFPIMESFSLPEEFLVEYKNHGPENTHLDHLYEISRLAVRPDHWFMRIDVGLHHLLILDTWVDQPQRNQFMVAVHPRAQSRYERIGMTRIPGTDQVLYKYVDQLAVAMSVDLETLLDVGPKYRECCDADYPYYKEERCFVRLAKQRMPRTMVAVAQEGIESGYTPPFQENKILVVDDDSSVVSAISTLLRKKLKDYEVDGAINGYEALIKVGEFKPRLLVLDIKMAQIDGLEVISRLKANKSTSKIKILAMTGHSEAYPENTVLSTGADDYLLKPFGSQMFINHVNALLA